MVEVNFAPLSIIIFILRNDRSFIYFLGAYLPLIYAILPSRLKRRVLKHMFKDINHI